MNLTVTGRNFEITAAIKKFIEKPLHDYPINIGNYLFTSSIIKKLCSKSIAFVYLLLN